MASLEHLIEAIKADGAPESMTPACSAPGCQHCKDMSVRIRECELKLKARDAELERLRGLLGTMPVAGGSVGMLPTPGASVVVATQALRPCALRLCEAPLSRFPHEYAVMDGKVSIASRRRPAESCPGGVSP